MPKRSRYFLGNVDTRQIVSDDHNTMKAALSAVKSHVGRITIIDREAITYDEFTWWA